MFIWITLIFLILYSSQDKYVLGTQSTVYYCGTDLRKYTESVTFCEEQNGRLLRYGQMFVEVVRTCEQNTKPIYVWTGTPWYKKIRELYM
jgi:hypothetical protein